MAATNLQRLLQRGIQSMALSIEADTQAKLIAYVELLCQWNAVHNLTAIREPEEIVTRHILDSLSVLPFLSTGKTVCDVGTGAGLPGIILALCKSNMEFVLLDGHQKKINFVQQALLSLRICNARAVCMRVERYYPETAFDWVISRAFSSLSDFIQQTSHFGNEHTTWLAMKGKLMQEELAALSTGYTMKQVHSVSIPHLNAERHLVMVKKSGLENP